MPKRRRHAERAGPGPAGAAPVEAPRPRALAAAGPDLCAVAVGSTLRAVGFGSLSPRRATWVAPTSGGALPPPSIEALAAHPLLPRVAVATSDKVVRVLELRQTGAGANGAAPDPSGSAPLARCALAEVASTVVPKRPAALVWVPPGAGRLAAARAAAGPGRAVCIAPRALLVGDKFGDVYLCEQERSAGGAADARDGERAASAAERAAGGAEGAGGAGGAGGADSFRPSRPTSLAPLCVSTPLMGHYNSTLGALDATSDGSLVVSADRDGKVRVTRVLRAPSGAGTGSPAASGAGEGRPVSAASGAVAGRPSAPAVPQLHVVQSFCLGHQGRVTAARFSAPEAEAPREEARAGPPGEPAPPPSSPPPLRLVTAGEDGTVRLWDPLTGAELDRVHLEPASKGASDQTAPANGAPTPSSSSPHPPSPSSVASPPPSPHPPSPSSVASPPPSSRPVAFVCPFARGALLVAVAEGSGRVAVLRVADRPGPCPHPGDPRAQIPAARSALRALGAFALPGVASPSAACSDGRGRLWLAEADRGHGKVGQGRDGGADADGDANSDANGGRDADGDANSDANGGGDAEGPSASCRVAVVDLGEIDEGRGPAPPLSPAALSRAFARAGEALPSFLRALSGRGA